MLDALASADVTYLPYLPDGVLAPLVTQAQNRPEFTVIPLTREEEGVGIAAGIHLGGGRAVLAMQVSGLGNSLNAIGSLVMAQRIPLLMLITERGGLGETVSTQVPFGAAAKRVLETVGVPTYELTAEDDIQFVVSGAAELAYTSRVAVAMIVKAQLLSGGAA
jgi:sulfopyruvate decarboxylase subunit alpha